MSGEFPKTLTLDPDQEARLAVLAISLGISLDELKEAALVSLQTHGPPLPLTPEQEAFRKESSERGRAILRAAGYELPDLDS